MRIFAVLLVAVLGLSACGFTCRTRGLTECDHPSGWSKAIRELATHSWGYSQLAYAIYRTAPELELPPWFREIAVHENSAIGFYSIVFQDDRDQSLVFVVRGTEDWTDWKNGNFAQDQNNYGLSVYQKISAANPGRPIVVAGHSLGGGVALHISLHAPVQAAYSFNGSPNFRKPPGPESKPHRFSIIEYGEILKIARIFGKEATQHYISIGCSDGNSIEQHSQLLLATCLTQIAAIADPLALESMSKNKMPRPTWFPAK